MFDFVRRFLEVDSLSPHGICLLWRPELIWTHAVSDALIGTAYFSIPVALAYFVSRRPDVAFTWVFWAFAAFILACGTTHYFSIWTLWIPDYGAEALIKAITAAASVATAVALWPLLPKAMALPSPAQLREANAGLERRVAERDEALAALRRETAERLKAEDMLRHSQKMESLGQLTGGIAHDFNNLLTIVLGNLESAQKRVPDEGAETVRRALQNARAGAERAAVLTHQLLAFGRKQPLQPVDLSVNEVVERVVNLLGRTLGDGIEIGTELGAAPWTVRADPNQLESALINLAVNARDAMPDGGRLTFRTANVAAGSALSPEAEPGRDFVLVEVADTGGGMSEDARDRAFEPFFTTKPVGQGSGLGLSQVLGFVAQSGGHVGLETALGYGVQVRLYLQRLT